MKRIILVFCAAIFLSAAFILVTRTLAASNTAAQVELFKPGKAEAIQKVVDTNKPRRDIDNAHSNIQDDWFSLVRESIQTSEYNISWQTQTDLAGSQPAFQAPNRAHNIRTYFTPSGVQLVPRTSNTNNWLLKLSLVSYGYQGHEIDVQPAELLVNKNQIEYQRGSFIEWYLNNEKGLEQGFTLEHPPVGVGDRFIINILANGDLSAEYDEDNKAIIFSTVDGKQQLRYGGLFANDALGTHLPFSMKLHNQGIGSSLIQLSVDAQDAIFPITIDPTIEGLSVDYSLKLTTDQTGDNFGYSVSTAGDVNNDGFDDVIVGAPLHDNGQQDEGSAFVYYGSSTGLMTTPAWSAEPDQAGANFGISVDTAGDVNDDGFADIIIGAYFYSNTEDEEGAAFAYYGSSGGPSTTPDWVVYGGNEDADFGASVSTAGDLNNDNYDDVIIGAPEYDFVGRVFAFYGSSSGLSNSPNWFAIDPNGPGTTQEFGISVSEAGDVNGDNFDDVIVGCSICTNYPGGAAFIYAGSSNTSDPNLTWTAGLSQSNANFGTSVGSAGDVNNDGYDEVIVGAPDYSTEVITAAGKVNVYYGAMTGPSTIEDWTAEGDTESAAFGSAVGTAGDTNGDDFDDIVIGASAYGGNGRAYLYQGSSEGLKTVPDWFADGEYTYSFYGQSVGTAGDVDGDTLSDVIIGSSGNYFGAATPGAAYIYYGLPDIFATNDSPTALGEQTTLTATVTLEGEYIYEWDLGDGSSATGQVVTHTYPTVGMYTAIVTATQGVREISDNTIVTIDEAISGLVADNDSPTVLGDATNFTALITAGTNVSYTWDFGDGNTGSGPNPSHTYETVGDYTATVTATNSVSIQSATTEVTIDETITGLSAENDSPTALGEETTLTASITTGSNVSYEWDFGDGTIGSGPVTTHTYLSVGDFTATVTATNSVSEEVATTIVTIEEAIAGLVASNDSPTIIGGETSFEATISAGTGVTYEWDFGDGNTGSGSNPTHIYTSVGEYTAIVTATNLVSSETDTTMVTVNDVAIVGLNAENDSPTTLGQTTQFTATISAGTGVVYEWDFGDGSTGSGPNPTHVYGSVGTFVAQVTATNKGSSATDTTVVTIEDIAIEGLSAQNNGPTYIGNTTTLSASVSQGSNVIYEWEFGDGSPNETGAVVIHIYPDIGMYIARVTATNGVSADSVTTVVVIKNYENFLPIMLSIQ